MVASAGAEVKVEAVVDVPVAPLQLVVVLDSTLGLPMTISMLIFGLAIGSTKK